jgi:NAD(P)-dependent dehydrogenase (short-subunit alcohol dehydrogenase family)
MQDLKGKVAFVTGGSSGIGLGIAEVLAEEGMKVAFTWRRQDHLDRAMALLEKPGRIIHPVKLDVTDREGFARVADEVEAALGPVQVLVNNAGVGVGGLIEDATYDDWDWVMGVNVGGVINGVVTFLPRMVASGLEGHIVNVSSMGGVAALGSVGVYATSKFAVVGLSEALRTDMIGRNIGVSVYSPGPVRSNLGEAVQSRPANLSNTGYRTPPPPPTDAPPHPMMLNAMSEVEAGRHVLRGIKANQLYIFSHPEFREVIKSRGDAMLAAVPDEPFPQARADSIRWILSNAIYSDGA